MTMWNVKADPNAEVFKLLDFSDPELPAKTQKALDESREELKEMLKPFEVEVNWAEVLFKTY